MYEEIKEIKKMVRRIEEERLRVIESRLDTMQGALGMAKWFSAVFSPILGGIFGALAGHFFGGGKG